VEGASAKNKNTKTQTKPKTTFGDEQRDGKVDTCGGDGGDPWETQQVKTAF
jgi:hypothetical protein